MFLDDDVDLLKYARIVEYNGEHFDRYYYDPKKNRLLLFTKSKRVKVIKPMKRGNNYESVAVTTSTGIIKAYNYNDFMRKSKHE
mgnify:CR=1 FL=1